MNTEEGLNRRQNKLVLLCALIIVIVALYAAVVNPMWSEWNRLSHAIARRQRELNRLQAQLARARAASLTSRERDIVSRWRAKDTEHTAYLAKTITAICKQSGMRLESMQPVTVIKEKTHRVHPLRVNLKGDIQRVVDFLILINRLNGVVEVRELSLHQEGEGGGLAMEVVVATFGQK